MSEQAAIRLLQCMYLTSEILVVSYTLSSVAEQKLELS